MRRVAIACLWFHVAALALGLFGLLFAIPHAQSFTQPGALGALSWGLSRGGALGMVTGALAMVAWGAWALGWRRTLVFAFVSCAVSAAAELTGTRTGWPFGGYEYLTFLGWKILGRVPYGVPLSWFYMGLAAYVLAIGLVPPRAAGRTLLCIVVAAWLLIAWDLVLDPAMAALPQLQFWVWHEHGPYFGMPLRNLIGWFATGVTFIALSRLFWGSEPDARALPLRIPIAIYVINVVWAMILAASAGLWLAAGLATAFALAPLALIRREPAVRLTNAA